MWFYLKAALLGFDIVSGREALKENIIVCFKSRVLCILTSKRVLCTLFAVWNKFFNAKTNFCMIFCYSLHYFIHFMTKKYVLKGGLPALVVTFFVYFVLLVMEKFVLASESLFWPANSVRSTQLLVEIHNTRVWG